METGFLSRNRPQYARPLLLYTRAYTTPLRLAPRALFAAWKTGSPSILFSRAAALSFSPLFFPFSSSSLSLSPLSYYIFQVHTTILRPPAGFENNGFSPLAAAATSRAAHFAPLLSAAKTHTSAVLKPTSLYPRLCVCAPLSPIAMQNPLLEFLSGARMRGETLLHIFQDERMKIESLSRYFKFNSRACGNARRVGFRAPARMLVQFI